MFHVKHSLHLLRLSLLHHFCGDVVFTGTNRVRRGTQLSIGENNKTDEQDQQQSDDPSLGANLLAQAEDLLFRLSCLTGTDRPAGYIDHGILYRKLDRGGRIDRVVGHILQTFLAEGLTQGDFPAAFHTESCTVENNCTAVFTIFCNNNNSLKNY